MAHKKIQGAGSIEQRRQILDEESREVLGWSLSDNMSTKLCLEALIMALLTGRKPEIFNTDQGSQYTSHEWLRELE